jgi:hypothetical protein
MTKISLIRLPDGVGEEVEKYAQERGLAFATAVRCIVVDHLKEKAPAVPAAKQATAGVANTPVLEVVV